MARVTLRSLAAAAAFATAPAILPERPAAQSQERAVVTANADYGAGWLHRLLLGAHYRDLWTTPIAVDVLDLERYGGGLVPTRCGGGLQTASVRFRAADGREYVLRSVDKDPSLSVPPELRATFAIRVLQDQVSRQHPAAPLVVAPLLDAAGVLHVDPRLVLPPDDPRLRPLPCARPGRLATIEERPTEGAEGEGFAGAADIISTKRLFERLEADPGERVASRAFLTARLIDAFVGDWDRHHDQWRWARFDREAGRDSGDRGGRGDPQYWYPIPRDRDHAFDRLDGALVWLAGFYHPQLVGFDDQYPSVRRLTWSGRGLDARLLADLDRRVWDSLAVTLRARLTDSVIDAAVRRQPPEYYAKGGAGLARALRARRDRLPEVAARFYALVARTAEVHASDQREEARVDRLDGGRVRVALTSQGREYYQRTFEPRETEEIRLYLHGGGDRLVVGGGDDGPIVRVVGGGGDDALADSARGGRQRFYDDRGENRFVRGPGTKIDTRRYAAPPVDSLTLLGPLDRGSLTNPITWLGYSSDLGLFLGGGLVYTGYGFRRVPYKTRWMVRAGWAIGASRGRAEASGEFRGLVPPAIGTLYLRASGIEALNFYGVGNETGATGPADFYKLRQQQYVVEPGLTFLAGPAGRFSFAAVFKHARTEPQPGSFIDSTGPYYGDGDLSQIGARAGFTHDTRDHAAFPTRGLHVGVTGSFYPQAFDVTDAFGSLRGEVSTYLSVGRPAKATLALRVGGGDLQGDAIPFHELIYVGGDRTVRGYPSYRFGGGPGVWGNAELRLKLCNFFVLLPGELGVFGLSDAGRVYVDGEASDVWHAAAGGGIWLSFLNRRNTLTVAVARSPERTGVYVRAGFMY